MGIAVSDLAGVVSAGKYKWYVYFLDDNMKDGLRNELRDNFDVVGKGIGIKNLAIRGYDPSIFSSQVYHHYFPYLVEKYPAWKTFPIPSLLLTNVSPDLIQGNEIPHGIAIVMPIVKGYVRPGSISDLLKELMEALQNPDSMSSLLEADKSKFQTAWGWTRKYFEIKPSFFGITLDVGTMLDDLFEG